MRNSKSFSDFALHPCFPALSSDGVHAVIFWIGQTRVAGRAEPPAPRSAVLFGWAYPILPGPPIGRWYVRGGEFKTLANGESVPFQFRSQRLSAYLRSASVLAVADALVAGSTLAEVSAQVGISDLPPELAGLRLAGAETGKTLVRSPTILETKGVIQLFQRYAQPESSPVDGILCYAASASLVEKNLLSELLVPESNPAIEQRFWLAATQALSQDTGLAFDRNDAGRIGDFELLDFPVGDVYGRSSVQWEPVVTRKQLNGAIVHSESHSLEVRITKSDSSAFSSASRVYVRCEICSDNAVISDEVRPCTFDGDRILETFDAPEQVCKVGIEVWAEHQNQRSLVFRDHASLVRQIGINTGIVGSTGRLQGGWSKRVNSKRAKTRIADAESFRRVQFERRDVGGYENDPWVPAARNQRERMLRLRPDISGARFFPIGWEPEFATWLKELTSIVDIDRVLLVDPYFDLVGLVSPFARAGAQNAKYSVLTAFNHRPNRGKESRDQLIAHCDQLRSVLPTYFSLEEVSPDGTNNDDPLIHDRYLFLWNGAGEVIRAFNLSNSLQGATRQHPMLATPIPADVLPGVLSYIQQIRNGNIPRGTPVTIKTLWQKDPSAERQKIGYIGPDFRLIGEALLHTRFENDSSAETALNDAGIYCSRTQQFNSESIKACLVDSSSAGSRELRLSIEHWSALSEISVRMEQQAGLNLLRDVILQTGSSGIDLLEKVISDAPLRRSPSGTLNAQVGPYDLAMGSAVHHSFPQALKYADFLLDRPYDFRGAAVWPLSQAVALLAAKYPDRLVQPLEHLLDRYSPTLSDGGATPSTYPVARAITVGLTHVITFFHGATRESLEDAFLKSRAGLVRAIGAASASDRFINGKTVLTASLTKLPLPEDELVFALAHVHNSLLSQRGRSRRAPSPYDPAVVDSKLLVSRRLLSEHFPPDLTSEKLREIARTISGPFEGCQATELELLFEEAARIGTLPVGLGRRLFFRILSDRLSSFLADTPRSGFFPQADGPLTLVTAQLCWNTDDDSRQGFFLELASIGSRFLAQLRAPFLRSRDYTSWSNSREGALWLVAFLVAINITAAADRIHFTADLNELRAELESALKPFPQEERIQPQITWFADRVSEAVGKRGLMEIAEYLTEPRYSSAV